MKTDMAEQQNTIAEQPGEPRAMTEQEKLEAKQRKIEAKQRKALAKQQKAMELQQTLADQFKRTQRYLGLRPTTPGVPPAVDDSRPVEFPFNQYVVFVCVDVESYEKAHHKITEIGVATLDTLDLVDVAPGPDGENWRSKINARHFRINEHRHLINHDFVHGCPDRFEFGTSEFIPLAEAATQTGACFKPPFCGQPEPGSITPHVEVERKIVFLGHDIQSDINYLKKVGFEAHALPNLLECVDSAQLYRVWTRASQGAALGKVLLDFDIVGWNLHNAGNDAVYTIQAMLAVCVREATLRSPAEPVKATPPKEPGQDEESDFEI